MASLGFLFVLNLVDLRPAISVAFRTFIGITTEENAEA